MVGSLGDLRNSVTHLSSSDAGVECGEKGGPQAGADSGILLESYQKDGCPSAVLANLVHPLATQVSHAGISWCGSLTLP